MEAARSFVAIEVKVAVRREKRFNRGLGRIADGLGRSKTTCHGIYAGERAAFWDDVRVLSATDFLRKL